MEEAESANASMPCCVVDWRQMIEGFEDLQLFSVSRHIFRADVLAYRLVINDWQASGRGKCALAVQHLLWYFGRSDGHKTCSALFLADLKKTLAVLLDNIMLRLGKLEAKVENIYNGTGGNLTNGTSTATPSATNSEKVNVAGKRRVCLLLISKPNYPETVLCLVWQREICPPVWIHELREKWLSCMIWKAESHFPLDSSVGQFQRFSLTEKLLFRA